MDHRLVSITTLGSAHFHELSQVDWILFEQHAPGRFTLKVVSANALSADGQARIATAVRHKTQGGCEVHVERVASIERTVLGKHRMLVRYLNLGGYLGASVALTSSGSTGGTAWA